MPQSIKEYNYHKCYNEKSLVVEAVVADIRQKGVHCENREQ